MAENDSEKLIALVEKKRESLRIDILREEHSDELIEQRREHLRELNVAKLQAERDTLRSVVAGFQAQSAPIPPALLTNAPAQPESGPAPIFHEVIDGFLATYDKAKTPSMYDKHKATLLMLKECIGDIPVTSILQDHLNDFFDTLPNLPPNWKQQCKKQKITIRKLSELDHPIKLSSETFNMHKGRVKDFLKYGVLRWKSRGFPTTLTIDGLEYIGDRKKGEEKQRALLPAELKRMFEGAEMESFANDPALAHQFWLPMIGLFTGARVNEICQLNPQTDILKDTDSGINYLWITEETESDSETKKSVKTGKNLKVPIHKQLIALGFLDYVERVRSTGAKRLFPKWRPIDGRAAGNAQLWFNQFLRITGLRDETLGAMITGMHSFRHTLLTTGANQKPPIFLTCITGHAQKAPVKGAALGYFGDSLTLALNEKATLLNQLDYGLNFFIPAH